MQLVGPSTLGSQDSPRGDVPQLVIVRPAVVQISWTSNLILSTCMVYVVLVAWEAQVQLTPGQRLMYMVTLASEIITIEAVSREQAYQLSSSGGKLSTGIKAVMITLLIILAGCIVLTGLAMGSFTVVLLDNYSWLDIAVSAVTAGTGVAVGILFVVRSWNISRQLPQKIASMLTLLLACAIGGVTLYGSTLSKTEREDAATDRGCFGDVSASRVDLVALVTCVLLLAHGALFLALTTPEVRCSAETRERAYGSKM